MPRSIWQRLCHSTTCLELSFSMRHICCAQNAFQSMLNVAGFVVNTSYIGSNANQIGMNLSSWQSCFQCGRAPGTCTAVQGSSPYDQFSTFRSSSLAAVVSNSGSNCSWITNTVMTFGTAQYPVQLVTCDYPAGLLSVVLQLNATAFGIILTKTTLSLVNSGQYVWPSGSLTGKPCVCSLTLNGQAKL